MKADTRTGTRLLEADAFLICHRASVRRLSEYIHALLPAAFQVAKARQRLRDNAPNLMRALVRSANANANQMALWVDNGRNESSIPLSRMARSIVSTTKFATFAALRLVEDRKLDPVVALHKLQDQLPPSGLNADSMAAFLRGLQEGNRLVLAKNLKAMPRALRRLAAELNEASSFVAPPHLTLLSEWSMHPNAMIRFRGQPSERHEGCFEFSYSGEKAIIEAQDIRVALCPVFEFE